MPSIYKCEPIETPHTLTLTHSHTHTHCLGVERATHLDVGAARAKVHVLLKRVRVGDHQWLHTAGVAHALDRDPCCGQGGASQMSASESAQRKCSVLCGNTHRRCCQRRRSDQDRRCCTCLVSAKISFSQLAQQGFPFKRNNGAALRREEKDRVEYVPGLMRRVSPGWRSASVATKVDCVVLVA